MDIGLVNAWNIGGTIYFSEDKAREALDNIYKNFEQSEKEEINAKIQLIINDIEYLKKNTQKLPSKKRPQRPRPNYDSEFNTILKEYDELLNLIDGGKNRYSVTYLVTITTHNDLNNTTFQHTQNYTLPKNPQEIMGQGKIREFGIVKKKLNNAIEELKNAEAKTEKLNKINTIYTAHFNHMLSLIATPISAFDAYFIGTRLWGRKEFYTHIPGQIDRRSLLRKRVYAPNKVGAVYLKDIIPPNEGVAVGRGAELFRGHMLLSHGLKSIKDEVDVDEANLNSNELKTNVANFYGEGNFYYAFFKIAHEHNSWFSGIQDFTFVDENGTIYRESLKASVFQNTNYIIGHAINIFGDVVKDLQNLRIFIENGSEEAKSKYIKAHEGQVFANVNELGKVVVNSTVTDTTAKLVSKTFEKI